MTPLPPPVGPASSALSGWTLVREVHFGTWSSGIGASIGGGRWNSAGNFVLYAALDPATAVLEVAVHKGFHTLDTDPHRLIHFSLAADAMGRVVRPEDVPNPNWLNPGTPSQGQQEFGDTLLATHAAILIPSVVSRYSWNLVINARAVSPYMKVMSAERFALDTRLHPPRLASA